MSGRWSPSKARLRWRLYVLLVLVDTGVLLFAHAAAGALRFGDALHPEALKLFAALLPLYGVAAFAMNAYSSPVLLVPASSVGRALKALGLALAASVFFIFLLRFGNYVSRFTFASAAGFASGGLIATRWFIARNASTLLGGNAYEVMVIADGVPVVPHGGVTVFVQRGGDLDPASPNPGTFDRLGRLVSRADRVVVSCAPERRMVWAAAMQSANVQAEVIAPELAAVRPLGIASHDAIPTMIVAQALLSWRDRVIKRGFDVIVAGVAVLLLAPLLLGVAVAVRLTSPGPALFRQARIGRRNEQFQILKFRTMRVEASDTAGHRSVTRDDDRVTRLGRFLRATSIDELPQLLNVLTGEMSIVGPRPHAVGSRAGAELFWKLDDRYWHRHAIKPGLTGLAQVRGFRGATPATADLANRLHADLEYGGSWSIWKDCAILLRTVPALFGRNAF